MLLLLPLIEELETFEDWEERYAYIIELGKKLPEFPVDKKIDKYKVDGCMSQVWLFCEYKNKVLNFLGDSDAFIVKGLIAVLFRLYNEKSCDYVLNVNAESEFRGLGLENHLSPSRRNGFFSIVSRINGYAEEYKLLK